MTAIYPFTAQIPVCPDQFRPLQDTAHHPAQPVLVAGPVGRFSEEIFPHIGAMIRPGGGHMGGTATDMAMAAISAVKAVRAKREARWKASGCVATGMIAALPLMAPSRPPVRVDLMSPPSEASVPPLRVGDHFEGFSPRLPETDVSTSSPDRRAQEASGISRFQDSLADIPHQVQRIDAIEADKDMSPSPEEVTAHGIVSSLSTSRTGGSCDPYGGSSHSIDPYGGPSHRTESDHQLPSQSGSGVPDDAPQPSAISPSSSRGRHESSSPRGGGSSSPRAALMMCAICGERRAGYMNRVCKHVGPCK